MAKPGGKRRSVGDGIEYDPVTKEFSYRQWRFSKKGRPGGFRTKTEARNEKEEARVKARERERRARLGLPATEPEPGEERCIGELAGPYHDKRTTTTVRSERLAYKNHLDEWFGHLRPREVGPQLITEWIEAKVLVLKPSTVRLYFTWLGRMFDRFKEKGLTPQNPCDLVGDDTMALIPTYEPRPAEDVPCLPSREEVRAVALWLKENSEQPIYVAYLLGALCGLRTKEVAKLAWEKVDLDAGFIRIRPPPGGRLKSRRARRNIAIPGSLLAVLKEHRMATGGRGYVVPRGREVGVGRDRFSRDLRAGLRALKLDRPGLIDDHSTWYLCTRHTYASLWVKHGGSIEQLSAQMGHKSVLTTERYYVDLDPEVTAADRGRLDVDLSAPAAPAEMVPAAGVASPTAAPALAPAAASGRS